MKTKEYSDAEIETLLQELAAHDRGNRRGPLHDRVFVLMDAEVKRYTRRWFYKRVLGSAAVLVFGVFGGSLALRYTGADSAAGGGLPPVAVQPRGEGGCRVPLLLLGATFEGGFRPEPTETYGGAARCGYGADVRGRYTYTACTDTL